MAVSPLPAVAPRASLIECQETDADVDRVWRGQSRQGLAFLVAVSNGR
ncbi:MAG: hypothetical protein HYV08_06630 [Deltaproteobacteria bacterium]|nr:hypothetical protein [Deltaproteobacteria bacterium]MBI3077398.1 hypothetical protein [Deltaproteobacteria bacterium]